MNKAIFNLVPTFVCVGPRGLICNFIGLECTGPCSLCEGVPHWLRPWRWVEEPWGFSFMIILITKKCS